ncbi:radical SAM protein [Clostridium botulinum]|uniref:Radical SAM protein n=1 Tax=Clostridium botulinum TaxID=1491 RepID=A0A6M0SRT1_CLOBO|nr:radical SAM protein [Clostridium botulinum]
MVNKTILVVATNREKHPCPVLPAGALQLTNELIEIGEDAQFLDLCFKENYMDIFKNTIIQLKPSIVVFSVRNIDNETYLNTKFYLNEVKTYVSICRNVGNIKTIIGGIGFIVNYKAVYNFLNIDYGILDRGFNSIISLIKKLNNAQCIDNITNLVYKKDGKLLINRTENCGKSISMIDWEYILNNCSPKYLKKDVNFKGPSSVGLQTKTGCRFQCIHCQISQIEGIQITSYPYSYIIDTLKYFEANGIEECFFTDNVFNYPYEHAYNLCQKMLEAKIKIKWSCYLNPKYVDQNLINIMKKAGCTSAQFGIDTASDKLLKLWRKGFTSKDIINAGEICVKENLNCSFSLIVGGWGEDEETLKESLNILSSAKAKFIWGALGVRVQLRTGLYKILLEKKIIKENDDLLKPQFYLSPQIKDKYSEIVQAFENENPQIIVKINEV